MDSKLKFDFELLDLEPKLKLRLELELKPKLKWAGLGGLRKRSIKNQSSRPDRWVEKFESGFDASERDLRLELNLRLASNSDKLDVFIISIVVAADKLPRIEPSEPGNVT